jgi:hypothetical protein
MTLFGAKNPDGSFNPLTNEKRIHIQYQSIRRFVPWPVGGEIMPADATGIVRRAALALFGTGLIDSIADSTILAAAFQRDVGVTYPIFPNEDLPHGQPIPFEVCEVRDRKGLYVKARAGTLPNFTGVSDPYEVPADAELTLDTTRLTTEEATEQIRAYQQCESFLSETDQLKRENGKAFSAFTGGYGRG